MTLVAAMGAVLLVSVAAAPVSPESIGRAAAFSQKHGETSLLVWRNGRSVFERHPAMGVPAPRIYSITKSLVAIGVFRDAKSGGLSLGQAVTFPAARGVPLADLLNQTSGLRPAHREFYGDGLSDKEKVMKKLAPGMARGMFVYGPSHWEVLAEEIRLHRGTPVERWLRRFVPGADAAAVARWRKDDSGRIFLSTGARMSARDLLPAGREVLAGVRGRKWPAEVRAALAQGTPGNRMYALGFWLNRGAASPGAREVDVEASLGEPRGPGFWSGGCLSKAAPSDLVAMIGTRGQRVYVVPSENLVIVRQGHGRGFSDAEFLGRLFGAAAQ